MRFVTTNIRTLFCFVFRKTENKQDECLVAQEKLHPVCAQRREGSPTPTCHSLAEFCREEPSCRHVWTTIFILLSKSFNTAKKPIICKRCRRKSKKFKQETVHSNVTYTCSTRKRRLYFTVGFSLQQVMLDAVMCASDTCPVLISSLFTIHLNNNLTLLRVKNYKN